MTLTLKYIVSKRKFKHFLRLALEMQISMRTKKKPDTSYYAGLLWIDYRYGVYLNA